VYRRHVCALGGEEFLDAAGHRHAEHAHRGWAGVGEGVRGAPGSQANDPAPSW
jgi:hypothetical protein